MLKAQEWLIRRTRNSTPAKTAPALLADNSFLQGSGHHEAAARMPGALATVATVARTFLIGDAGRILARFSRQLIYLSCAGVFLFGRIIMPEPLFTASSRERFTADCAVINTVAIGNGGLPLLDAAARLHDQELHGCSIRRQPRLLSLFYREARLRFRELLRWHLLIFLVIATPWHIWTEWSSPAFCKHHRRPEWISHL